MKRDMELVVSILEFLEKRQEIAVIEKLELPGQDTRNVAYHLCRMYEAGLIDAEAVTSTTTKTRLIKVLPFGLTWQGHEFLDALRNKTVAAEVRKRFGGAISEVPFSLIKDLAIAVGRAHLGI